jgi:DNA-binding NtrC family response regulator
MNRYSDYQSIFMTNQSNITLLIVDDEELVRWSLEQDLKDAGYNVLSANNGEKALKLIQANEPDMVLLDIKLPGMSGFEVLHAIQQNQHSSLVMMLTVVSDIDSAVAAVKAGAIDYVTKPFEFSDVLLRIEKNLQQKQLIQEVKHFRSMQSQHSALDNIVAVSPATQDVIQTITQIAGQGKSTVLIRGESGVGKDLFSKAVHNLSPRASAPFIEVNCPSFPAQLLENELFGHERGAFTDARARKEGLVELANKGTVFLNEISEINANTQAKLLNFLEKKTFRRIGSTREREVDVRVIAATNQNLEKLVGEGQFRQDLFYRLNVIPIFIPPLRARKEDVPPLIEHFLHVFRLEFSKPQLNLSNDVMECLVRYNWPGNVRELKNCMERMVLLTKGNIIHTHVIPKEILDHTNKSPVGSYHDELTMSPLAQNEVELIKKALEQAEGNQSRAARILKISRDTLRYRLKKYHILN